MLSSDNQFNFVKPNKTMERRIKNFIYADSAVEINNMISSGLIDPNFERGWAMRLAARLGSYRVVKALIQNGADPHLLSESGASTLQLAVFSSAHWETDRWNFLLSCCDSSQLADGAAVAIIFNNVDALRKILETGRCNTNIPTTLTGRTLESLAKGYKLDYLLNKPAVQVNSREVTPNPSPQMTRQSRAIASSSNVSHHHRNLSPSVARFFHQTAGQSGLTPPRNPIMTTSPVLRP